MHARHWGCKGGLRNRKRSCKCRRYTLSAGSTASHHNKLRRILSKCSGMPVKWHPMLCQRVDISTTCKTRRLSTLREDQLLDSYLTLVVCMHACHASSMMQAISGTSGRSYTYLEETAGGCHIFIAIFRRVQGDADDWASVAQMPERNSS